VHVYDLLTDEMQKNEYSESETLLFLICRNTFITNKTIISFVIAHSPIPSTIFRYISINTATHWASVKSAATGNRSNKEKIYDFLCKTQNLAAGRLPYIWFG